MVKSLILCEGGDDIGFLNLMIKFLNISKNKIIIQKLDYKSNFFKLEIYKDKNILSKISTGQYDKLLLIFDSDYSNNDTKYGGFENSIVEIQKIIEKIKNEIGFDFHIDYYIMCDPITKDGNLEHLIISTLSEEKQKCVNNLLKCIQPHNNNGDKKIVLSSYKTIFDEPNYNFPHINFENLIQKINNL